MQFVEREGSDTGPGEAIPRRSEGGRGQDERAGVQGELKGD